VKLLLALEGAALGAAALVVYAVSGGNWLMFLLLCLAPDLAMLGYLAGPRIGSMVYNALHHLAAPLALLLGAWLLDAPSAILQVALIWIVHIGIDRAIGYGLKYPTGFKATHLQSV
jgi:hypothetical protein